MSDFNTYGFSKELLRGIEELGFEKPTPIQEKAIPYLMESTSDLIGQAQTGTGKTAAFGLPIIQKSDLESKKVQTLILCPTRELCIQLSKDLQNFSKYIKGFKVVPIYGGASIDTQLRELRKKPQVVVGTPGRTLDMIKRRKLIINDVKWLVLDEADEMLSMGFKDELDGILENTPEDKQTLLFSATMPHEIKRIIGTYMHEPFEIKVGKVNKGADNVEHYFYMVNARDRFEALKRIADANPNIYGIVFCRTRAETKDVAEKLIEQKYNADALHGDMSQFMRDQVMNRFRTKHLQILVATDVAARGLDVDDLTHIINYNLPDSLDIYIHRSGRTGRAGKKGVSVTIVHSREQHKIRLLEKKVGKKIERRMVPGGNEICEKQLYKLIDKIGNVEVDEDMIAKYLPTIYEKFESLSKEELIKHFVSIEFNYFLDKYKKARDLNTIKSSGGRDRGRDRGRGRDGGRDRGRDGGRDRGRDGGRDRGRDGGKNFQNRDGVDFAQVRIDVGSSGGMRPAMVLELINTQLKKKNVEIGRIDIRRDHTKVEIDKKYEKELLSALKNADFKGGSSRQSDSSNRKRSNIEYDRDKPKRKKRRSTRKKIIQD
ncbi:DEAD/DEAH box helicase [bacterium]|nr:DEAD/DEAH box helicase [bacterium]